MPRLFVYALLVLAAAGCASDQRGAAGQTPQSSPATADSPSTTTERRAPMGEIAQMSVREVRDELTRNPTVRLIDVREQDEWNAGHIDGATLMPLSGIRSWAPNLDPDSRYIFYCRSGNRSNQAASFVQTVGVKNVANTAGGFTAWSKEP